MATGTLNNLTVTVLFFAQFRDRLKTDRLECAFSDLMAEGSPDGLSTVDHLRKVLVAKGGDWKACLEAKGCMVAVNQEMAGFSAQVQPGDEVAFFPPVTGG